MGFLKDLLGNTGYDITRELPPSGDYPSREVIITSQNISEYNDRFPFIFLDFHAHWCAPCKKMAPKVKWLAKEMKGKIVVGTVNIENEKDLSQKYKVMSVPTYILLHYDEEMQRWKGKTDITKASKEILGHWKRFNEQLK